MSDSGGTGDHQGEQPPPEHRPPETPPWGQGPPDQPTPPGWGQPPGSESRPGWGAPQYGQAPPGGNQPGWSQPPPAPGGHNPGGYGARSGPWQAPGSSWQSPGGQWQSPGQTGYQPGYPGQGGYNPQGAWPNSGQQGWGYGPGYSQTSGKATAALVLSITSVIVIPILPGIAALILAGMARGDIRRSGGQLSGNGMALAAIIVSIVAMVGWILFIVAIAAAHNGNSSYNYDYNSMRAMADAFATLRR